MTPGVAEADARRAARSPDYPCTASLAEWPRPNTTTTSGLPAACYSSGRPWVRSRLVGASSGEPIPEVGGACLRCSGRRPALTGIARGLWRSRWPGSLPGTDRSRYRDAVMTPSPNVNSSGQPLGGGRSASADRAPLWLVASVAALIVAVLIVGGLVVNRLLTRDLVRARARDARLQVLESAADARPTDLDAALSLAHAYQQHALYREALARYKKVLSADPENLGALYNTGLIQLARGNAAAAEESLSRVLALSPTHPLAARVLAEHYVADRRLRARPDHRCARR